MGFRTIQGPKSIMIKMSKKGDFGIYKKTQKCLTSEKIDASIHPTYMELVQLIAINFWTSNYKVVGVDM